MNEIYQYRQEGQLYLWCYVNERNYPGYHMAWSGLGQKNFIEFLNYLALSESGTYRTLILSKPTVEVLAVPNNKNSKISYINKLRIEINKECEWKFSIIESNAHLTLSSESALKLAATCEKVKSQVELYHQELSFWW
jgi:hypothetical protein